MITGLNSPLPGIKIESFRDILCDRSLVEAKPNFNITQWIETSKISSYWGHDEINTYNSSRCFQIWSPDTPDPTIYDNGFKVKFPSNELVLRFVYFYLVENRIEKSKAVSNPELIPYSHKIIWSLLHPGHRREPEKITRIRIQENRAPSNTEIDIENQLEITNCEKKTAIIAKSDDISAELNFLTKNYFTEKFYVGKDAIAKEYSGIAFAYVRNTKIPKYYRIIIEAGIYDRLQVEKMTRKNRGRKTVWKQNLGLEGVSSLSGGLMTLFMLCGGLLCLAISSFILECRGIIWGKCQSILHKHKDDFAEKEIQKI
jgi:hypothetical protein